MQQLINHDVFIIHRTQKPFKLSLKAKISLGYISLLKKKSLRQVFQPREVLLLTIVLMEPNEVIAWRR